MGYDRRYRKGPHDRINQVRLSEALHSRLKAIASRDDRSLSYVIRKACEEYAIRDDLKEVTLSGSLDSQGSSPKPVRSNSETSGS